MVANKQIEKWQKEIATNKKIIDMNKHKNSRAAFIAEKRNKELTRKINNYKSSPFLQSFGNEQND